jgi:hypothetical protein
VGSDATRRNETWLHQPRVAPEWTCHRCPKRTPSRRAVTDPFHFGRIFGASCERPLTPRPHVFAAEAGFCPPPPQTLSVSHRRKIIMAAAKRRPDLSALSGERDQISERGEPSQRLAFELSHALAGQVELVADRLERPGLALEAEAELEDPALPLG